MAETTGYQRFNRNTMAAISDRWQKASPGGYLIFTDPAKVHDNWLVCHFGTGENGKEIYLTTDCVHASDNPATAETQAEFFAHAWLDIRALGKALVAAEAEIDRLTGQRIWQRWWEPRKARLLRWWLWKLKQAREVFNFFGPDGKARWWWARQLDKRTDTCWSSLVMWASFGDTWGEWRDCIGSIDSCKHEAAESDGTCYCGKCATKKGMEEAGCRSSVIVEAAPTTDLTKTGD